MLSSLQYYEMFREKYAMILRLAGFCFAAKTRRDWSLSLVDQKVAFLQSSFSMLDYLV